MRALSPYPPATFALPEQEEHWHRSDSTAETTIRKELPSLARNIFPEFHAPTGIET